MRTVAAAGLAAAGLDGKRMVVIIFDDYTVTGDLATLREARKVARRTIDGREVRFQVR